MEKTRYTDEELEEFRLLIAQKLDSAKSEFRTLQGNLKSGNEIWDDETNLLYGKKNETMSL